MFVSTLTRVETNIILRRVFEKEMKGPAVCRQVNEHSASPDRCPLPLLAGDFPIYRPLQTSALFRNPVYSEPVFQENLVEAGPAGAAGISV